MTDTPLKALIAKLVAGEGSRELDAAVFHAAYPSVEYSDRLEIWTYKGEHVLLPHYTTSIDAKLPWENIVEMAWHEVVEGEPLGLVCAAWHETSDGSFIRTMGAHTTSEAIARRIAALKAQSAQ